MLGQKTDFARILRASARETLINRTVTYIFLLFSIYMFHMFSLVCFLVYGVNKDKSLSQDHLYDFPDFAPFVSYYTFSQFSHFQLRLIIFE